MKFNREPCLARISILDISRVGLITFPALGGGIITCITKVIDIKEVTQACILEDFINLSSSLQVINAFIFFGTEQ